MIRDLKPGPLNSCQVCSNPNLEVYLNLGHQPLCDTLPDSHTLRQPEPTYPLRQVWCNECGLSQLDHVVPSDVVFHNAYPYRSGVTKELADYQDSIAKEAIKQLNLEPRHLVIDVGSNDGTLLKGFQRRGIKVLGIEPTDIAKFAVSDGIPTIQDFFDKAVAEKIREMNGPAKLITATNVFAHVSALKSFLEGLQVLLDDDGVFLVENHYLIEILKTGQFDTVYHEHLRTYSLHSLVRLFKECGFTVMDAREVSRYGGNIRVYVGKGENREVSPNVDSILAMEKAFGLFDKQVYEDFRLLAENAKNDLLKLAIECKQNGHSFVGNSCPGRCATLLNFAGFKPDLMPWIAEQPMSLKLNRYLAGTHIPIVNNQRLIDEQPDFVVLLAWHYAEPIAHQLRRRGLKSKLVVPLPKLHILEI